MYRTYTIATLKLILRIKIVYSYETYVLFQNESVRYYTLIVTINVKFFSLSHCILLILIIYRTRNCLKQMMLKYLAK